MIEQNNSESNSQPVSSEEIEVHISDRKYRGFPDCQRHQMEVCWANADLREGKNISEN